MNLFMTEVWTRANIANILRQSDWLLSSNISTWFVELMLIKNLDWQAVKDDSLIARVEDRPKIVCSNANALD